ncbi:type III secretion system YscI/HrpB-like protein [Pseudomonas frederiksbergensis]|uniref:type III secretion system inner rod subunit SctI n=1 Tax=Pseudomonas frederiksbergensis TaxID=104087 RepID=UPI003D1CB99B
MEIEAVTASPMREDSMPPIATPSDIAAFNQALFGQANTSPEISAITELQKQSRSMSSAIATAQEDVLNDPLKMMAAQSKMLHAIVEVDLIAKTAGALSQGVNKLVSMQ